MISLVRRPPALASVWQACTDGITDNSLKARLLSVSSKVNIANDEYQALGQVGSLSLITPSTYEPLSPASKADFTWLYETRLVRSVPGRVYYDRIKSGNDDLCALCSVRPATTLDHHLPKEVHPTLSINPLNLLPSCADCNHAKGTQGSSFLNAYFDDLGNSPWLLAEVKESRPFEVTFSVDFPTKLPAELRARAHNQFESLALGRLYALQSVRFISNFRLIFAETHEYGGEAALRSFLFRLLESHSSSNSNGWEAAVLREVANSAWFCKEGFRL